MRLDRYLTENGMADSREKAKKLILGGCIQYNGAVANKPSAEVLEGDTVLLLADLFRFVSRGGEKLEAALTLFGVDPAGLRALDVGASTGGFTDCLLQHGAAHVVALDAGCGQLAEKLRKDPRVTNLEKYNARALSVADVGEIQLAVMDVSFISATYIIPGISAVLPEGGRFLCLIKPQFEAGRAAIGKNGIVRRAEDRKAAILRVLAAAGEARLQLLGLAPSPIRGGDGNEEFLAHFRRVGERVREGDVPVDDVVNKRVVLREWRSH